MCRHGLPRTTACSRNPRRSGSDARAAPTAPRYNRPSGSIRAWAAASAHLSRGPRIDRNTTDILVRRLRLRQGDSQHAVLEGRARLVLLDRARKADPPLEAAIAELAVAAVFIFD